MVTREPLPDYSSTIRAQIEREVEKAKTCVAYPSRVSIGYFANSHHGLPLFKDGDTIAGLSVVIDQRDRNQLTVHSAGEDLKLRR